MNPSNRLAEWTRLGAERLSAEDEAKLLTEILTVDPLEMRLLVPLAQAHECQTIVRCAAIDRYLQLMLARAHDDPEPRELRVAREFLLGLAQFPAEPNEDVRFAAAQWYIQLDTDHPDHMRSKDLDKAQEEWRKFFKDDPSPRMQWLMSLGQ
jgi:hypothetical protein